MIDSISQALLWIYFEDGVKKLYPLGLRGAQEVTSLIKDLGSKTAKTRNAAEETLKNGAALMGLSRESFIYTLLTVTEDPYAKFLYAVWD